METHLVFSLGRKKVIPTERPSVQPMDSASASARDSPMGVSSDQYSETPMEDLLDLRKVSGSEHEMGSLMALALGLPTATRLESWAQSTATQSASELVWKKVDLLGMES